MNLTSSQALHHLNLNSGNATIIDALYNKLHLTGATTHMEKCLAIKDHIDALTDPTDTGLTEADFGVTPATAAAATHAATHAHAPADPPKKRVSPWVWRVSLAVLVLCIALSICGQLWGGVEGVQNSLSNLMPDRPADAPNYGGNNDEDSQNTSSEDAGDANSDDDNSNPGNNSSDGNALDVLVDKSHGMMSFGWEEATWIGDGKMSTLVIATNALNKVLCVYEAPGNAVNFTSGMIKGNFVMAVAPEADFIAAGNEVDCDTRYYIGPNSTPSGWGDEAPDGWGVWVNQDVYEAHNDTCTWPKENGYNVPYGTSMTIGGGDQTYFQGWNGGSVLYRFIVQDKQVTINTSEKIEGTYWDPSGCSFDNVLVTFNTMNEEQVTNFVKNGGTPVILNIYIGDGPVPAGWTDVLPSGVTVK
jgi:hypothetical protein